MGNYRVLSRLVKFLSSLKLKYTFMEFEIKRNILKNTQPPKKEDTGDFDNLERLNRSADFTWIFKYWNGERYIAVYVVFSTVHAVKYLSLSPKKKKQRRKEKNPEHALPEVDPGRTENLPPHQPITIATSPKVVKINTDDHS